MKKERLLKLLESLNDRSERYIKDAEERNDTSDAIYYQGQQKVVKEIRDMVSKWS